MGHKLMPFHSELYHGKKSSKGYFEGWYFKHVNGDGFGISFIPGVFKGKDEEDSVAFIQIILNDGRSYYIEYEFNEFTFNEKKFEITIGDNYFSIDEIKININRDINIIAHLTYDNLSYIKKNILAPSIMGIFSYMPYMQCNHGILSMNHNVYGSLVINDENIVVKNMLGYIEKDYGESFPSSWIWMQGNNSKVSFLVSIASIPLKFIHFIGLLCVIKENDKEYRFTTYNFSKIKTINEKNGVIKITLKKRKYVLEIEAIKNKSAVLKAPTPFGMNRDILESINSVSKIKLFKGNDLLLNEEINGCGLEYIDHNELIKK